MMMYEADKLNRVRKLAKRQEYLKEQLREYKESLSLIHISEPTRH